MAVYNLTQSIPTSVAVGDILNCPYSGTVKSINLPKGTYKLECWGAESGKYNTTSTSGKGGYSRGTLSLSIESILYLYSGGQGTAANSSGGFNGGGSTKSYGGSGGGGSDIRINSTSLYARCLVAGGGGGPGYSSAIGGYGGGLTGGQGGNGSATGGYGGTQTSGGTNNTSGSFGQANSNTSNGGGGGGGWYGGSSGWSSGTDSGGGGGSGYAFTSITATNYPTGCLLDASHYLTDTLLSAGNISITLPTGTSSTGNSSSGYIRITVLSIDSINLNVKIGGSWKKASKLLCKIDGTWKVVSTIYYKVSDVWRTG